MDAPIGQWCVSERQEPPGNKQWGCYVPQRWRSSLTSCFGQSHHHLLPAHLPTASYLVCLLLLLSPTIYFLYHRQNNPLTVWVSHISWLNHMLLLFKTLQGLPSHSEVPPWPVRPYFIWYPWHLLPLPFHFPYLLVFEYDGHFSTSGTLYLFSLKHFPWFHPHFL